MKHHNFLPTFFLLMSILLLANNAKAQAGWEVGLSTGVSLPVTGYKEVLKSGWLLGAEGKYRFGDGRFAVGMKTDFVRLQKDKNPSDTFQNARMTLAPILFTAEYEVPTTGALKPYVSGGLGLSIFNLNYDVSPTEGHTDFNVSFTMAPRLGLRYKTASHLLPFIETNLILLADGPPQGFPKGEKMTGYMGIEAGVSYRF
jgi:opacity protein-like surface antigen